MCSIPISDSVVPLAPSHVAAPALFCEPEPRDFGQRFFGHRGFGGLLEDTNSLNSDGSTKWIPQYNLQNFWRRYIPPLQIGLIEPLVPPRSKKNDFHRLPGHFSFRANDYELYNRNLLASRFFENDDGGILKIWTVNERSKRQVLETFSVDVDSSGTPCVETLQAVSKLKLKMMPPVKNESCPPRTKEPLLELRTSVWSERSFTRLYLRSPSLLKMINLREESCDNEDDTMSFGEPIPIFHYAAKSFAESHLLEGTMAVVDYGGRVWIHDVSSKTPQKPEQLKANNQEIYQYVAFCDHPKMVAIAGNFHVETVDMRCSNNSRTCVELWRSPVFETRGHQEALYIQDTPPTSSMVRHISRLQGTANHYVIMTDRALHLVDDRFAGTPVLGVKHPFSSGTHHFIVSERIKDSRDNGNVYSIFCLDQLQVLNSSISMTKLYAHSSGIWSSVNPFQSIGEPGNFNQIVHRGKYASSSVIVEPTRAMSLVDNVKTQTSLLLRQTDDGAIWWQKFSHEEICDEKRIDEERKSMQRITDTRSAVDKWSREEWRPVYSDELCEEVKEGPKDTRQVVQVGTPLVDRRVISKFYHQAVSLQRKASSFHITPPTTHLDVLPLDDVNSVLSKITLDSWKATTNMMAENSS